MTQRLIATGLLTLAAVPAYAQEHAAEGAGLSPFAGNVGNALWTLVIFLLVVTVLGKFAWGPILALLQQREEFIHRSLADAKRDREEAETRLKDTPPRFKAPATRRRRSSRRRGATPSVYERTCASVPEPKRTR